MSSTFDLYVYIYIWLGPLRSTPKPNTALKSSWSDLQAAKESGGILECLKIEKNPWSGPKTIISDTLYTHEFNYVDQPNSMKVRLRGAKMLEFQNLNEFRLEILFKNEI